MKTCVRYALILVLWLSALVGQPPAFAAAPNIVFIPADDLGYGDAGCYHKDS